MAQKPSFTSRFMNATGKLRMFFGPAARGTTAGEIVYRDDAAQSRRQQELQQWDVVRNADGSSYLSPRKPQG
ncbi:hypothetical protein [Arthrobacter sp. TMS2-4]